MTEQLKKNWDAFKATESRYGPEDVGKTVLLYDGQIIKVYDDSNDAYSDGCREYGLGNFSTQTIGEKPISLGMQAINMLP